LKHHREVIPNDPMFGEAVIGEAVDVDVFNGEALALRRRNASEYGSLVRAAPAVVTNNEVVFGDELQGLPVQIPDGARDALDRLAKLVEPDLGLSVRLMVRNVRMNQTLEIDGSRVPLVIELLNNGFVCFRANGSPFGCPAQLTAFHATRNIALLVQSDTSDLLLQL
jgi:hypothetical protein